MDFKQLEAFVKVVEYSSFSKAADELFVSQPSISNYITSLEKELSTVLINRSTKVFSVTLAGERFLAKAKEMLALKQDTILMLKNLSVDIRGDIRILASSVPVMYILPPLLAEFHKLYPKTSFTVHQADTSEVVLGIAAHKGDIGFAGSFLGDKKCVFHEFAQDELVFIAPNDGSYSEKETYSLEELLYSSSFISREFGSGTRISYEKYFTENGIFLDRIKTRGVMDSTHSIINAVSSGLGISMVSELAVRHLVAQKLLMVLRPEGHTPVRKIYMVLNKNHVNSHLVELFMEYVQKNGDY